MRIPRQLLRRFRFFPPWPRDRGNGRARGSTRFPTRLQVRFFPVLLRIRRSLRLLPLLHPLLRFHHVHVRRLRRLHLGIFFFLSWASWLHVHVLLVHTSVDVHVRVAWVVRSLALPPSTPQRWTPTCFATDGWIPFFYLFRRVHVRTCVPVASSRVSCTRVAST